MKTTTKNSQKTKKIVIIGLFTALAFVVSAVLPIKVSFLTLDFKDAISTICGMFFGPVSGLVCALIVPFIEATYSGTGVYGLIMNIISSVTLVGISSPCGNRHWWYKERDNGVLWHESRHRRLSHRLTHR